MSDDISDERGVRDGAAFDDEFVHGASVRELTAADPESRG